MRTLALFGVVALVACGSAPPPASPTPAPAPAQDDPVEPAEPVQKDDPALGGLKGPAPAHTPPSPTPPPAGPTVPIYSRLRDEGPVPGLAGYSLAHAPDPTVCGGQRMTTRPRKVKPTKESEPLVAVFKIAFPKDLDFTPGKKTGALEKFNAFVEEIMKVSKTAVATYESTLTAATDDDAKYGAMARIAQVSLRVASVLARAEIPKDVRTGEFAADKSEAFCERMTEVAEPLVLRAEEAIAKCSLGVATYPQSWWVGVCR